jgi:single-strand DNA-binding protein
MGRLTKDPDVRRTQDGKAVARYTLAVDRRSKEKAADFISCVAFDKKGEFAEQYLRKGIKIAVTGRIQTGEYTNQKGEKVYTTDVVVEDQEFCEKKSAETKPEGPHEFVEPAPGEKLPWD